MQETPRKGADTRERILDVAEASVLYKGFAATSIELGQLGPGVVALGAATLPMESFLNGAGPRAQPREGG